MRTYNLCNKKDYDDYISSIPFGTFTHHSKFPHTHYTSNFYWFYIKNDRYHRLGGSSFKFKTDGHQSYYIDGIYLNKKNYYNHPDMIQFKYLKKHPELKSFI